METIQLDIFARSARQPQAISGDPDGLRGYQREAVTCIAREFERRRSTLLVMATGLGKTQTFGCVAKHHRGRVLVIAHRDELIQQAARRMEAMTGERVGIEKASETANGERIVVGSVQSVSQPSRLGRMPADRFSLVVVDECHHAISKTYVKILSHFAAAKVLGVTATPKRADDRAMGKVFESVAYTRTIEQGIEDAYLSPIAVASIYVEAIDLRAVRTVAGDFNRGDLDAAMAVEEALHGVAKPTIEQAGDRKTIVFTTSVANAHRLAEIFDRYKPGSARAVDGETDTYERRAILRAHARGEFQFLVNMGVLTEGYDDPTVACIAMARPTKSQGLYTQCVGRGLRILDGIGELPTVEARRAAIAASAKRDCLLLDFSGQAGKHMQVTAVDVLGGSLSDSEKRRAKKIVEKNPAIRLDQALEKARQEEADRRAREAAKRAHLQAEVTYRVHHASAFRVLHMPMPERRAGDGPANLEQTEFLARAGIDIRAELPPDLTAKQAATLIRSIKARRRHGLATFRQVKALERFGVAATRMYFQNASRLMEAIKRAGWRPLSKDEVSAALQREPGEEG